MTPRPAFDCAHERRPGTTVCLYCRADERAVVRKRRQRAAVRIIGAGGVAAAVVAALLAGVSAVRGTAGDAAAATSATATPQAAVTTYAVEQAGDTVAAATPAVPATAAAPVVPEGRTDLADGIFAQRSGDTVIVHFDTPAARTRRSDKFENVVRETLPAVLGDAGRKALERVEPGTLVPPGQLVASVNEAPLRLPTGDGRVVSVMPGARMGAEGPLVVTYQVVVDPAAPSPTS